MSACLAEVEPKHRKVRRRTKADGGSGRTPEREEAMSRLTKTQYENNARAKSTGDRVIELRRSRARQREAKANAFNMRV